MTAQVTKQFPGGPGFKIQRVWFLWRWWAWPNENASSVDYYVAKGWSRSAAGARAAGRAAAGFDQ